MEYEIDTEHEALGTFGRAMPRRSSHRTLPAMARSPLTRVDRAGEQFAELIPESEELA